MSRVEPRTVQTDLGLLTHRLISALHHALVEEVSGGAGNLIGPRHRAVLANLDSGGTRAIELGRRCGQHKQVIGTLVDDLERLDYVRREPDPRDRRAKLIVPTESGLAQTARIAEAMDRIEDTIAESVGADTYREFKQSFERVADLLSGN